MDYCREIFSKNKFKNDLKLDENIYRDFSFFKEPQGHPGPKKNEKVILRRSPWDQVGTLNH